MSLAFTPIEEPIGTDTGLTLIVPMLPRLDRAGRVTATVQLWNGSLLFTDHLVLTTAKDRRAYTDAATTHAGGNAEAISSALLKLDAKLGEHLRSREPAAADEQEGVRQQQSLCAPGMVCVAEGDEGEHVYIIRHDDGTLVVQPSVVGEYRGMFVEHIPPADPGWVLPRAGAVLEQYRYMCDTCDMPAWGGMLLKDLEVWHRAASDLGKDEAYLLLALYDLLTYAIEHTDYLPIIVLEAEPERGKSRTGQAAMAVMRHGIWLQGIREANLIRAASDRRASMFIDLMDVWKRLEKAECTDILLGRWERGGTVERVLFPDKGPFADTVSYEVFGPTIVATNEPIHRILDTRCLRIDMPLTGRRFTGRVQPEAARPLIERLMAWRAHMLGQALPDCDPPADGRLGDILRPLRQVLQLVAPDRIGEFDAIVAWQDTRRRDDLAGSTEAALVKAVAACDNAVRADYLPLSTVLAAFNADRPESWKKTERWLGGKLRGLGWRVGRIGHHNITTLMWDDTLLLRLQARYSQAKTGDRPEPPPTPRDVSHVSHQAWEGPESATRATPTPEECDTYETNVSHESTRDRACEPPPATHATHATGAEQGTGGDMYEEFDL